MLALLGLDDEKDESDLEPEVELHSIAKDAVALFDDIESALRHEVADKHVNFTLLSIFH